jgi:hypothetical protein
MASVVLKVIQAHGEIFGNKLTCSAEISCPALVENIAAPECQQSNVSIFPTEKAFLDQRVWIEM